MGCDIHCYIEYRRPDSSTWSSHGGRINPGRSYGMFGRMAAGVRCNIPNAPEPKGLPSDVGYYAESDSRVFISETPSEDYVTLEKAESWVKNGSSELIYHNDKPTWVTNPDWHSHSWLSIDEFAVILDNVDKDDRLYIPQYFAILATMLSFKEQGYKSRLVFWFDN